MKIAFLFPGQGSQYVGMGADFYSKFPIVQEVYKKANDILKFDIKEVSFKGPEDKLKESENAQVSIFVHSYAIYSLLIQEGITPALTAGHSLGEYSALVASGGLSFEDAITLVRTRGRLMSESGWKNPGTMAAILGLSSDIVETICDECSKSGIVNVANYNSPRQTVISGEKTAVNNAMEIAKKRGALKTIPLSVSGAFHSLLMKDASIEFQKTLEKVEIKDLTTPLVANVSAQPIRKKEEVKEELSKQILSSIRWVDSMKEMFKQGIDTFIEVGPGKVLKGLLLQIESSAKVGITNSVDDYLQVLEMLKT